MNVFKWEVNKLKKLSKPIISLAFSGFSLIVLSLGSIFSKKILPYNIIIFAIGVLISWNFMMNMYIQYVKDKITVGNVYGTCIGIHFLVLLLGVQSPQIPYKNYLLVLGILMMVPASLKILKK